MTHRPQWLGRPFGALLLALVVGPAAVAQKPVPQRVHHELKVALEPATRLLRVEDRITLSANGTTIEVTLAPQFDLQEATLDGHDLPAPDTTKERQRWSLRLADGEDHQLVLRYTGHLAPLVDTDHRGTLDGLPAMAAERGSFLPAGTGWYPQVGDVGFSYRLQLELPPGQRGLAPGRLIEETDSAAGYRATFEFSHPDRGHRSLGRALSGARAHARAQRRRADSAAHLVSPRDRRPRTRLPRRAGPLSHAVQRVDRRVSLRRIQRGVEPFAYRLRHAHTHLSRRRGAAAAVHQVHLPGTRGAAQLVGQRRVRGPFTRQLVRGAHHLHGGLYLQGAGGSGRGACHATGMAARLRGPSAATRTSLFGSSPRARTARRRLSAITRRRSSF